MPASAVARDPRFLSGVADFNAGAFFEAHEAWEALWNDSEGETKRFVQALVQLAAGYHKLEIGVRGGAVKLLGRALAGLANASPALVPFALAPLEATVRAHRDLLVSGGSVEISSAPRLEVLG
jgi:hypothetical protein